MNVSPNSGAFHFIWLFFHCKHSTALSSEQVATSSHQFGKKPQTILSLQLEMHCLSGKERGRVECTWRETDVHLCGNQDKTHSCWGSSSIVVRIPCCGNPNHKLELCTKHCTRSACAYLLLGLLGWRWQHTPQTADCRNLYTLIQLTWPTRSFEVQDKPL